MRDLEVLRDRAQEQIGHLDDFHAPRVHADHTLHGQTPEVGA